MLSKLNFLLATVFIISFFQEHVNCSRRHWEICSCTAPSAPFFGSSNTMNTVLENWRNFLSKKEYHIQNEDSKLRNEDSLLKNPDIENRDVVDDIPLQCPIGYRPDSLGNCRKRVKL